MIKNSELFNIEDVNLKEFIMKKNQILVKN